MKVFLSSDMEGTAGIVDWEQCIGDGPEARAGRRLLLAEVNAAIEGALAGGAIEVLVNDAHSVMRNLAPEELRGRASYLSGQHKPLYMMEGLDETFDAIFFVSYHAAMPSPGTLSHTYNPRAVRDVRINGTMAGESGINALVAEHFAVPVALVTGDQFTVSEAAAFCPGIIGVQVKRSVGRHAAESLHPELACERIRHGAERAVRQLAAVAPPSFARPLQLEVDFASVGMAELATSLRGVEQVGPMTVRMVDDEPLRLYRTFIAAIYLTRVLVEPR